MIKKIILSVLVLCICRVSYAQERENFYGLRYDYMLHFGVGTLTSISIVQWERCKIGFFGFKTKEDYGLLSLSVPISLGIIKEIIDNRHNNGNFFKNKESWRDLGCVALGAIFGKLLTYTWSF